jgi:uncharacterized protein
MKILWLAAITTLVALVPAHDAAALTCPRSGQSAFSAVCSDKELRSLAQAIETRHKSLVVAADPATAMLLRRDNARFEDILGDLTSAFTGGADPQRVRVLDLLRQRADMLQKLRTTPKPSAPVGAWANAFGSVKIAAGTGDHLTIAADARGHYQENEEPFVCAVAADLALTPDGWFTGATRRDADAGDADVKGFLLRIRLQGGTLRVVMEGEQDDPLCPNAELVTGSYFPLFTTDPLARGVAAAPPVSPSFDCGGAKNLDEQEICADPELAALDGEIARAYREALRQLDPNAANHLRTDQRSWVKENALAYDSQLHPAWAKQSYFLHHGGIARAELLSRLKDRHALLTNLDTKRRGFEGFWLGHDAMLRIEPADDKPDGTLRAVGQKWDSSDYKSHCDFEAVGRIRSGRFETTDSFPSLARDGMTLTLDADGPDRGGSRRERPDYCSRMPNARARLFPVRSDAATSFNPSDGRIR